MEESHQERDYGKLENIQAKINRMRQESRDANFTRFLMQMQTELDRQTWDAARLEQELNRNYQIYLRMNTPSQPVYQQQPMYGQQQPQVQLQQPAYQQIPPQAQQPAYQQIPPQAQQPAHQQIPPQVQSQQPAYQQIPPQVQTQQPVYQQPVYQPYPPQGAWNYAVAPAKKKTSIEFQIGAGLFCVIGVLFILSAFVMLGMTYMNGMIKGLSLYAIALVLILVSELFLRKKMEKFSLAITGLGISSLYASTLVNFLYLHNFNSIIAMCITLLITVFAILLGRKKDSGIIKVISFLGCYSCFLPVGFGGNNVEFATVTGILFVINIMTICLPVKKAKNVVNIVHMISNTIFTFLMAVITYTEELDARLPILYVCTNLLVIGIIFRVMEREEQKTRTAGMYYDNSGNIALYIVMLFVQSIAYICCSANAFGGIFKGESAIDPIWFHVMMATFVLVAAILFVLFIKSELKWIQYYVTAIVVFYTYSMIYKVSVESAIALLVIFVISKLLSRVKALKASEMIITLITVCTAFIYWIEDAWYGSLFAAVFLLSILALYHFKPFYQAVITFALICYLTISLGELPLLPAVNVSVLFLLLLLFNNVKWWRGRKQAVYNYGNLAFMLFWCVAAIFVESYLNCAILALLGTAVVVLGFQKKYAMDFRFKYLFLVLFWTYMTFISRIEIAVVLSSILMVIAIASVVLGFALKRREVRIYGLVLSILVCLKVVFYDFMETPMLEKMILFLIVGVIILAISGIYIVLEKKLMNRGGSI